MPFDRLLRDWINRFAQRSGYRRELVPSAAGCNVCPLRADVAQLVEQRFRKPQVTGSNPVVGSAFAMTDLLRPADSVSIIVPTLNEEENIAPLVALLPACAVSFRVIL